MIDTNGWRISPQELPGYKAEDWNPDFFMEVADGQYGVYIYNLDELRMGDYSRYKVPHRTNEVINLEKLNWHSLALFDAALFLYHQEPTLKQF